MVFGICDICGEKLGSFFFSRKPMESCVPRELVPKIGDKNKTLWTAHIRETGVAASLGKDISHSSYIPWIIFRPTDVLAMPIFTFVFICV